MNSSDKDSTKPWATDIGLRIDEICDEFELSYQRNEQPRIEDYLDETIGHVETQLAEMVMIELAYRRKAGEEPTVHEYVSRFPSYEKVVEELSDHFEVAIPGNFKTPPLVDNLESFEFLGSGSFGCVWKAWDAKLRRFVAVKTPIQLVPTQSDRDLIQREARVVARAKHPYVVPVYATGEVKGRVYVVYEFVPGTTLKDYLKKNKSTPQQAAILCAKIAEAVHHVHELGIVHRDLKPANILIDPVLDPHVMDFGLAKLLDASATIAQPDEPLGTPAYMSPEQVRGKSAEMDLRSDIYSLGVILYELLSGSTLFDGGANEVMRKVLVDEPAALAKVVPGVDRNLALICHRCLEKEREDRYRTAAELAEDLRRFATHQPIKIRPIPLYVRLSRRLNHHRRAAVVTLLVTIPLLLLSTLLYAKFGMGPPPIPPRLEKVKLETVPAGATVAVLYCDPKTGEADRANRVALVGSTPATLDLIPGRYLLIVKHLDPQFWVCHEVHRTVPGASGSLPPEPPNWQHSKRLPTGEIEWPPIKLPSAKPLCEMVPIPGAESFTFQHASGPKTVKIEPFYVSTREFTNGDLRIIHPLLGDRVGPSHKTMPSRYDFAEHWAEEAGGRLLTDIEFAYLADLASKEAAFRKADTGNTGTFDEAGSATIDEISTAPPIRGILTGYAEWTSTWPTSSDATVDLGKKIANRAHPELFRLIRGGTLRNAPGDSPYKPSAADVSYITSRHSNVGFRLARTAEVQTNEGESP